MSAQTNKQAAASTSAIREEAGPSSSTAANIVPSSLSAPTQLTSYSLVGASKDAALPPTAGHASAALGSVSVGEVLRLGSDGSVTKAKRMVVLVAQGKSIDIIDPRTQAPVQSFHLRRTDIVCAPPLVVIRSVPSAARNTADSKGASPRLWRTTYAAVRSPSSPACEVWSFHEGLTETGALASSAPPRKETLAIPHAVITSLHVLSDGVLVAYDRNGGRTLLKHDKASTSADLGALSIGEVTAGEAAGVFTHQIGYLSTRATSSAMLSNAHLQGVASELGFEWDSVPGAKSVRDAFTALEVRVVSGLKVQGEAAATTADKGKRRTKRASAMEVIDAADGKASASGIPTGSLRVEVSAVLSGAVTAARDGKRMHKLATLQLDGTAAESIATCCLLLNGSSRLLTVGSLGHDGSLVLQRLSLSLSNCAPTLEHTKKLLLPALGGVSASLLAVSSSHMLVASALTDGSLQGLALLIDADLGSVLGEQQWDIIQEMSKPLSLCLASGANSRALVLVSGAAPRTSSTENSAVWVLPYTAPDGSVLKHSIGKAALTKRWMGVSARRAAGGTKAAADSAGALLAQQRSIVEKLQALAMGADRDAAFAQWVQEETVRVKEVRSRQAESDKENKASGVSKPARVPLSQNFVRALLELSLPATKKDGVYAPGIVTYLLERRAINSGMQAPRSDGTSAQQQPTTVQRLRSQNDWAALVQAVRLIPDVREEDCVALLMDVLRAGQGQSAGVPSVATYLAHLVAVPLSSSLLRTQLRTQLTDADDVVTLLLTLKGWLKKRARLPLEETTGGDAQWGASKSNAALKAVVVADEDGGGSKVPPVEQVIVFLTLLLDTYFPLLLATPSTHALLRSLSRTIDAHLVSLAVFTSLSPPLSAFARLEADRKANAAMRRAAKAAAAAEGADGARRRPPNAAPLLYDNGRGQMSDAAIARAQTGGGVAVEQARSKRLDAHEANALAGPYTIETLAL